MQECEVAAWDHEAGHMAEQDRDSGNEAASGFKASLQCYPVGSGLPHLCSQPLNSSVPKEKLTEALKYEPGLGDKWNYFCMDREKQADIPSGAGGLEQPWEPGWCCWAKEQ